MVAIGMLVTWAGYSIATWGYILVRGWDIPLGQWVSPLHPYTWPAGGADPPLIPTDQLTPSPASAGAASAAPNTSGVGTPHGQIPGASHSRKPSLGKKK